MPREDLQWSLHKEISHTDSGITIRINQLPLRKPIYSFEIGVLKDGGYLNRFFPSGLPWETDFSTIVSGLIDEACKHISDMTIKESESAINQERDNLEKEKAKRQKFDNPRKPKKKS